MIQEQETLSRTPSNRFIIAAFPACHSGGMNQRVRTQKVHDIKAHVICRGPSYNIAILYTAGMHDAASCSVKSGNLNRVLVSRI